MSRYNELWDDEDWFDVQQVCLNGHLITDYGKSQPNTLRAHCSDCGAPTLTACPTCTRPLRGHRHISGVFSLSSSSVDRICPDCGAPFPWTALQRQAVSEWLEILESLSAKTKEEIEVLLPDLFTRTARSELAAFRLKKALANVATDEAAPLLRAIRSAADAANQPLI